MMDTWRWFRPYIVPAIIVIYTVLLVWAVLTDAPVPGIWIGQ